MQQAAQDICADSLAPLFCNNFFPSFSNKLCKTSVQTVLRHSFAISLPVFWKQALQDICADSLAQLFCNKFSCVWKESLQDICADSPVQLLRGSQIVYRCHDRHGLFEQRLALCRRAKSYRLTARVLKNEEVSVSSLLPQIRNARAAVQ